MYVIQKRGKEKTGFFVAMIEDNGHGGVTLTSSSAASYRSIDLPFSFEEFQRLMEKQAAARKPVLDTTNKKGMTALRTWLKQKGFHDAKAAKARAAKKKADKEAAQKAAEEAEKEKKRAAEAEANKGGGWFFGQESGSAPKKDAPKQNSGKNKDNPPSP